MFRNKLKISFIIILCLIFAGYSLALGSEDGIGIGIKNGIGASPGYIFDNRPHLWLSIPVYELKLETTVSSSTDRGELAIELSGYTEYRSKFRYFFGLGFYGLYNIPQSVYHVFYAPSVKLGLERKIINNANLALEVGYPLLFGFGLGYYI